VLLAIWLISGFAAFRLPGFANAKSRVMAFLILVLLTAPGAPTVAKIAGIGLVGFILGCVVEAYDTSKETIPGNRAHSNQSAQQPAAIATVAEEA
jgi:hypothetical protein